MQIKQFNGEAARSARLALGLSQGAIARDTLVSRPELSRFENGWLVLSDDKCDSLIEFFEEQGATFESIEPAVEQPHSAGGPANPSHANACHRILDGVCVAPGLPDDLAESLANELQEHQAWLDQHLPTRFRPPTWFASDKETEAMRRMARATMLLRQLQGRASAEDGALESHLDLKLRVPADDH